MSEEELLSEDLRYEVIDGIIYMMAPGLVSYDVDPVRQAIADSWPDSLDCSASREDWGFAPRFDSDAMTREMLERVKWK